jgi:hypothetical protein
MVAAAAELPAGPVVFPEEAPPSPRELFREHVAAVLAEGDALDARRSLWKAPIGTVAVAASVAGSVLYETGGDMADAQLVSAFGVIVVAGCCLSSWSVRDWMHSRKARERLGEEVQEALNARYELYRIPGNTRGKDQVAVHWHGIFERSEDDPLSASDHLKRFAELAKGSGITAMTISNHMAAMCGNPDAAPGTPTTVSRWLGKHKQLKVGGRTDKELIRVATPDDWIAYARDPEEPDIAQTIDALLERLAKLQAGHPLLRINAQFESLPAERRIRMLTRLRETLADRLHPEAQFAAAGGFRRTAELRRPEAHAEIVGDKVLYRINGRSPEVIDLGQALGIHEARMQRLFESGSADPRKLVEYIEYQLYKTLRRQELARYQVVQKTSRRGLDGHKWPTVSEELGMNWAPVSGERISLRRQRVGQALTALCSVVLTGGVLGGSTWWADHNFRKVEKAAAAAIARENGQDPHTASIDPALVRERMGQWHGANDAWGDWYDFRKRLQTMHENIGRHAASPSAGTRSGVGNVAKSGVGNTDGADVVEWKIEAHGGMNPAGYWTLATSSKLSVDVMGGGVPTDIYWTYRWPDKTAMPVDQRSDLISSPDAQYLKVSHDSIGPVSQDDGFIRFSVLDHTRPVAATYNGQKVMMFQNNDGTYIALLPSTAPSKGKLEYWLVPASKGGPSPNVGALFGKFDSWMDRDKEKIDSLLRKEIPGYAEIPEADTNRQARLLADYIRDNFKYSLQPLPPGAMRNVDEWYDFFELAFRQRKANCNVASTLVPVIDPKMNAEFSYLNKRGAGENVLTSREQHQTVRDRTGERIDPTPTTLAEEAEPDPSQSPLPFLPLLGLAGLAALGAVIAQRKQLVRAAGNVYTKTALWRAEQAERELQRTHASTLRMAASMAEQAAWSPNNQVDLKVALGRATDNDRNWAAARQELTQPHVHGKPIRQLLQTQRPGVVTPAVIRVLKLAERVAQRPRNRRR